MFTPTGNKLAPAFLAFPPPNSSPYSSTPAGPRNLPIHLRNPHWIPWQLMVLPLHPRSCPSVHELWALAPGLELCFLSLASRVLLPWDIHVHPPHLVETCTSSVCFIGLFSVKLILCLNAQSCPTLRDPMGCSPWDFPGKIPGVVCHFLLHFLLPDFPDSGIEPTSPASPALAGKFFTTEDWEAPIFLLTS